MKNSLLVIVTLLSINCYGQSKIKKLDVAEKGFEVSIKFTPVVSKIQYDKNFNIEITPVSANELNSFFNSKNQLDGKFQYSYYEKSRDSYFLKKERKKKEKSDFEYLIEGINWLLESEKISQYEYEKMYLKISANYMPTAVIEETVLDENIKNNPYLIGNKYMNVFKLEIINSSDSVQVFNDKLLINFKTSVFQPLSNNYIINEQNRLGQMSYNKSLTLERFNLNLPLLIPPKTTIFKFFSILPIDVSNDMLFITSDQSEKKFSWKVNIHREEIDKTYSFYEFNIVHYFGHVRTVSGECYSLLLTQGSDAIFLDENKLFVSCEATELEFSILFYALYSGKLFFARTYPTNAGNLVNLSKSKRESIKIESQEFFEGEN